MTDLAAVKTVLRSFRIELPSWAFGLSGTRFRVFGQPGVPRPTCGRCWLSCGVSWGWTRTRWRRTPARVTRGRSRPSG